MEVDTIGIILVAATLTILNLQLTKQRKTWTVNYVTLSHCNQKTDWIIIFIFLLLITKHLLKLKRQAHKLITF